MVFFVDFFAGGKGFGGVIDKVNVTSMHVLNELFEGFFHG